MNGRYANIVGWGMYVPERVLTNADLEKLVDTNDEWIVKYTGIHERRVVSEDEQTSQMAIDAAREALSKAGIRPYQLDLIIVATSSPDYLTPPISSQVQHALGARRVGAFTLVNGCAGFLYGLVTAQQFIASGNCERVLLIGTELISRWLDYSDRNSCILFGDGAGAVVLEASDKPAGVMAYTLNSDGSKAEHLILPGGGSKTPPSQEMLEKKMNYVHMNGREVFKYASRVLGMSLRDSIREAGLTPDDIDLFIPHQANKRIIEIAAHQAGIPPEKTFFNIEKYGNTSAASIPIALCEALETGRAEVGDTLAFTALGAGVAWSTAVVKLAERELPKKKRTWRLPFFNWFSRNGVETEETTEMTETTEDVPVQSMDTSQA